MLVAEEAAGIHTLQLLSKDQHNISGVLTYGQEEQGRSNVASVARRLGYSTMPSARVKDPNFASWIKEHEVDVLLNIHALYVIHPDIIRATHVGAFNLHPGPLPSYAGLNAPSWAVFRDEPRHAVTLHWMATEIDTGDIAYETSFDLGPADTGLSVSAKCIRKGLNLVERLLDDLSRNPGSVPRHRQDLDERSYFYRDHIPWDGILPWPESARRLDAFVRACDYHPFPSPWGHPRTSLEGNPLEIVRASLSGETCSDPPGIVGRVQDKSVAVATGDEWLLVNFCKWNGKYQPASNVLETGQRLGPD